MNKVLIISLIFAGLVGCNDNKKNRPLTISPSIETQTTEVDPKKDKNKDDPTLNKGKPSPSGSESGENSNKPIICLDPSLVLKGELVKLFSEDSLEKIADETHLEVEDSIYNEILGKNLGVDDDALRSKEEILDETALKLIDEKSKEETLKKITDKIIELSSANSGDLEKVEIGLSDENKITVISTQRLGKEAIEISEEAPFNTSGNNEDVAEYLRCEAFGLKCDLNGTIELAKLENPQYGAKMTEKTKEQREAETCGLRKAAVQSSLSNIINPENFQSSVLDNLRDLVEINPSNMGEYELEMGGYSKLAVEMSKRSLRLKILALTGISGSISDISFTTKNEMNPGVDTVISIESITLKNGEKLEGQSFSTADNAASFLTETAFGDNCQN
ncbi:MAG: hypothetical protein H6621_04845 [Halobacteriovoraceae bacterium]|nr:hypothetical protein [Halobacteriovoraceae bacterium]